MAISGNTALVGAYTKSSQGAAYIYSFNSATHTWDEEKITASDAEDNDYFGYSVAISGNSTLIGAYGKNSYEGAVYLYRYNPNTHTWNEQILTASTGAANNFFGYSVALSDNSVLVGAYGKDNFEGAAYLYSHNLVTNNWDEVILTASDGLSWDYFGVSVALSGNTALVGSILKNSEQGAAYLYQYNSDTFTWDEKILTASDGVSLDYFGSSVALSGNTALVGAYGKDSLEGAAYLYRYNPVTHNWDEEKLMASDGAANSHFGSSVFLFGNTAVVGASDKEAVYVFHYNSVTHDWDEEIILSSDGADLFGSSVSLSGNTALVGAHGKNTNKGAVYFYYLEPPVLLNETKLIASDGAANDNFGYSVDLYGDTAMVGSFGDNTARGAVYFYRYNPTTYTWDEEKITASDSAISNYFGYSVALYGSTALVGAVGRNSNRGAAYLYRFNPSNYTWDEIEILTASDGVANDYFAASVALSEGFALVGALGDDSFKGGAYRYFYDQGTNDWIEEKLIASDGANGHRFGASVALSGNNALIGASGWNTSQGAAYLYLYNSATHDWEEEILTASDGVSGDQFGSSVALSGNTALVGAPISNTEQGSAYLYRFNPAVHSWDEEKFLASDGQSHDFFGQSVALSEDTVLIGAAYNIEYATGEAAYLYRYNYATHIWEEEIISASDGADFHYFGMSVALFGNTVLVGSFGNDTQKGAIYIYR